jgi:hypothetical protein
MSGQPTRMRVWSNTSCLCNVQPIDVSPRLSPGHIMNLQDGPLKFDTKQNNLRAYVQGQLCLEQGGHCWGCVLVCVWVTSHALCVSEITRSVCEWLALKCGDHQFNARVLYIAQGGTEFIHKEFSPKYSVHLKNILCRQRQRTSFWKMPFIAQQRVPYLPQDPAHAIVLVVDSY